MEIDNEINEELTPENIGEENAAKEPAQDQTPGRVFTQEDVDEIVKKRLERERNKAAKAAGAAATQDLERRAARLDCKEYVLENGLPLDLLDILNTDNVEDFKAKAGKIAEIAPAPSYPSVKDGGEIRKASDEDAAIRAAFGSKVQHKPKEYNPYR